MKLKTGEPAPDFSLPDQEGKEQTFSDYKGQWILLYFYPKDDTPGCTKEACALRDAFAAYKKLGATIIGISVDPVQSHGKFVKKYTLPFALLSDETRKVVKQYGAWGKKKFMGREFEGTHRMSFLIDPEGAIAKIYEAVKPAAHAEEVLDDLRRLNK